MSKLLTDRIYLVSCTTKGTFYIEVKERDETWTYGKLVGITDDVLTGCCFLYCNGLIKLRNSLCTFILIEKKTFDLRTERGADMKLKCVYDLEGTLMTMRIDDIVQVKEGFYITGDYRMTEDTDEARCWIPPSAIRQVFIDHPHTAESIEKEIEKEKENDG